MILGDRKPGKCTYHSTHVGESVKSPQLMAPSMLISLGDGKPIVSPYQKNPGPRIMPDHADGPLYPQISVKSLIQRFCKNPINEVQSKKTKALTIVNILAFFFEVHEISCD